LDQWYLITKPQLVQASPQAAAWLEEHHGGSLAHALRAEYPEHEWQDWRFASGAPRSFWLSTANQRSFFVWALAQLYPIERVQDLNNWYQVKQDQVVALGGYTLLKSYYNGSLGWALMGAFPDHAWLPWLFREVPKGVWTNMVYQQRYFEWLAKRLQISELSDWYTVSTSQIYKHGGRGLLNNHYDGSLTKALAHVYPTHPWEQWRFKQVARRFWDSIDNQRDYFDWLEKQLNITTKFGWYSIKTSDVDKHGGLVALLVDYYFQLFDLIPL
jgi:hypothetical protein